MSQITITQIDEIPTQVTKEYSLKPPIGQVQGFGTTLEPKQHELMDFITPALGFALVIIAVVRWCGVELTPGALAGFGGAAFLFAVADCTKFSSEIVKNNKWLTASTPVLQVIATICMVVFPVVLRIEDSNLVARFNDGAALCSLGLAVFISGVRTMLQVARFHSSWKKSLKE